VQSGHEAGERLLAEHAGNLPDAVVCANDQMAIGVLQSLARAGVRVPSDVSVVGFDDIYPGSLQHPPLTTVHQPMRQLGQRACERLLERIAAPELAPTVQVLATELVVRASCGCPPGTLERRPATPVTAAGRARRSRSATTRGARARVTAGTAGSGTTRSGGGG